MKVVVIGCTHAGTAAILNLKKINPDTEITVFERNDNIFKDYFTVHLKN